MATRTETLRVNVDVDGDRALAGLADRFARLGKASASAAVAGAKAGATVAGLASLAGPAVSGMVALGKATVAVGKGLATIAPLVATLPALIGGFALISGTLKMAGPAIGKALSPIGEAFKSIQSEVGALAAKGLPAMAREFVKVNFPAIRASMRDIAESANLVLRETMGWVNSANGQATIRDITNSTALAMRELAEPLSRVTFSFGEMVRRVGGGVIGSVAGQIEKAADATIRWMDSIDKADIDNATKALAGWGGKIKDTFTALKDIGTWMADNEEKVKKFSDVVAGMAIVIGAATGNWVAVLAGAASLSVNHWDETKKAFKEGGAFVSDTWNKLKNDPNVKGIFESIKTAFGGFVDTFKKQMAKLNFKPLIKELKNAWEEWAPLIKAWWDGVGKPVFSFLGLALASFIAGLLVVTTVGAKAFAGLSVAMRAFLSGALTVFGTFVNGAAKAFGWMPGIGPKLAKAADDFNKFRDRVNAALAGIKDEDVRINVRIVGAGADVLGGKSSSGQLRFAAAGGRFRAGEVAVVGEQGPELVKFGGSAEVLSNARSMRELGSGGSGATRVELVAAGSGDSGVAQLVQFLVRTGALKLRVVGSRVTT